MCEFCSDYDLRSVVGSHFAELRRLESEVQELYSMVRELRELVEVLQLEVLA